jgi:hypothetical protein
MRPGFAAEDGVALHFRRTRLKHAVSSRPDGSAFRVEHRGDGVVETPVKVTYLGGDRVASWPESERSEKPRGESAKVARRPRRRAARPPSATQASEQRPVAPEPLPA